MQQRQPRLGDILDDYCPRERRLTNHAVVAMVGDEVKQTRCTTCEADHEYKHARVPRQRPKDSPAGLTAQVLASAPKRAAVEPASPKRAGAPGDGPSHAISGVPAETPAAMDFESAADAFAPEHGDEPGDTVTPEVDGPAHRRLIRATLPRIEGAPPLPRQAPDFTIRQPTGGRPSRFRARQQRPGQPFQGNRSSGQPGGKGQAHGGGPRQAFGSGRPSSPSSGRRHDGGGRKRSK
jgi:hypothetical protein